MKPIRIFVINNPTPAFFMVAYYLQENLGQDEFRNICILMSVKGLTRNDPLCDFYKKIAQLITSEIFIFSEPEMQFVNMRIRNIVNDRKRKKSYLGMVKEFFAQNNIEYSKVREIYHANRNFHQYVKYLSPKAVLISFEHGLSDIRGYLLAPFKRQRIKNFLKVVLGRLFFVFYDFAENDDLLVSLFASRIKRIHPRLPIELLKHDYMRKASRMIIGEDIKGAYFVEQNGSVAVVLLEHINSLTDRKEDHLNVHRDFLKYILGIIERFVPKVDTLIFKAKKFDIYFCDVKAYTMEIFKNYKVVFFDEIGSDNYPIECCLDFIKPKIIFGNSSTGLFYSKELMPEIKTYTFHPYLMCCLTKNIGNFHDDFYWIPELFYKTYRFVFEDILPVEIPYSRTERKTGDWGEGFLEDVHEMSCRSLDPENRKGCV